MITVKKVVIFSYIQNTPRNTIHHHSHHANTKHKKTKLIQNNRKCS